MRGVPHWAEFVVVCPRCLEEFELRLAIEYWQPKEFFVNYIKKFGLDKFQERFGLNKESARWIIYDPDDPTKGEKRKE